MEILTLKRLQAMVKKGVIVSKHYVPSLDENMYFAEFVEENSDTFYLCKNAKLRGLHNYLVSKSLVN